MDIWAWVHEKENQLYEAGEHRLAEIIDMMPTHCCDDEHDAVDALYAEGIPLAQKAKEPWVEVFIRHWYLQSQVLTRNNAKGMLSEAIELLDLAHREEAKGCPQRICAVQDLANCYGTADGPGFAEERLAVSRETLAEINPSWPCFTCIGGEYIDALLDNGAYDEVLDECQRLRSELVKHEGQEPETIDQMHNAQARALIRLGRYDEALSLLTSMPVGFGDGSRGKRTYLLICMALAYLGKFDQIDEHMVPIADILKSQTYYNDWAEIQAQLVIAKQAIFDDGMARTLWAMSSDLIANGSYRCALNLLLILSDLAIKNDYLFNASLALEKLQTVILNLNKDCGAQGAFDRVNQQFLTASKDNEVELFSNEQALLDYDFSSVDAYAQSLKLFVHENPDNIKAVSLFADILGDCKHKEKGLELIECVFQRCEADPEVSYAYGRFLLKEYGRESLFEAFDSAMSESNNEDPVQQNLQWLYAHAHQDVEPEKAIKYFENYLQSNPQHEGALFRLAWLNCDTENYDRSIEVWNSLIELDPDNENFQWDKLIPATLKQDWQSVRDCSGLIGIKLEGESGEVNQAMGSCRIRFDGDLGAGEVFYAHRTGPVSATIKSINQVYEEQRYGQELVFNPAPLNALDQKDGDGDACDSEGYYNHLYEAYRVTTAAPYLCYAIDGVHPGAERVEQLIAMVEERDFVFEQRSNENYLLGYMDEAGEMQESPGFYAYVLIPPNADKLKLHSVFNQFNQALQHPLIWPKLLEELELTTVLEEQSLIEEKYGL